MNLYLENDRSIIIARVLEYDLNLLTNYLIKYPYDELKLTIDEIEKIACGKLPDFMHTYTGSYRFWYNDYNRNPAYAHYWLDAGYLLILILKILLFILTSLIINILSERPIIKSPPLLKKLI